MQVYITAKEVDMVESRVESGKQSLTAIQTVGSASVSLPS